MTAFAGGVKGYSLGARIKPGEIILKDDRDLKKSRTAVRKIKGLPFQRGKGRPEERLNLRNLEDFYSRIAVFEWPLDDISLFSTQCRKRHFTVNREFLL